MLEVANVPLPVPGPRQIRVRHQAIGVNYIDTYHRSGLYPIDFPAILGQEAVGVVDAVGDGVTRFKENDVVAYVGQMGAYAEASLVRADRAVKVPLGLSSITAAGALLKGMTAEFLVNRCYAVKPGDVVLAHAAAGGVGSLLVQWAKLLGARVIGTAGSPEKAARAKALGCDEVILYRHENVAERVKALTDGRGVDVAYDAVGRETFEGTLASIAPRGLFVSYGNASGAILEFSPLKLMRAGSVYFTRPTLADYTRTTEELDASANAVFGLIKDGKLKVDIGSLLPLVEAHRAHTALEARETTGATVMLPFLARVGG